MTKSSGEALMQPRKPVDQLFAGFGSGDIHKVREAQRDAFEERCILQILRFAEVPFTVRTAQAQLREQSGGSRLTFEWFQSEYPAFPMQLVGAKLPYTGGEHIGWTQLFGKGFVDTPWCREYMEISQQHVIPLHEQRLALVFNAPHAHQASLMVLHNYPVSLIEQAAEETRGTRIVRGVGNPRVVYVLESFSDYLQTIGTSWAIDLRP